MPNSNETPNSKQSEYILFSTSITRIKTVDHMLLVDLIEDLLGFLEIEKLKIRNEKCMFVVSRG